MEESRLRSWRELWRASVKGKQDHNKCNKDSPKVSLQTPEGRWELQNRQASLHHASFLLKNNKYTKILKFCFSTRNLFEISETQINEVLTYWAIEMSYETIGEGNTLKLYSMDCLVTII